MPTNSAELRKSILRYLQEWERSGKSEMPDAGEIAGKLKIHFADVLDQFDILDSEGAIKKYGHGEKSSATITGRGKAMLESLEKNTDEAATSTLTGPTAEAIKLLEELVSRLSEPTFNVTSLPAFLRKYKHAIRLLGMDEDWVSKELDGYLHDVTVPSYRDILGKTGFVSPKDYTKLLSEKREARLHLRQSVSTLLSIDLSSDKQEFCYCIGEPKEVRISGYGQMAQEVEILTTLRIRQALSDISEALFDRVSKELITLKFGKLVESIFKDYQLSVDEVVGGLDIGDYLKNAYQDLARDNEASWQSAALACRTMMQRLADTLWQAPGDEYPYLKNKDGSGLMRVTEDKPRNRLRSYLHQKGIKGDSMLVSMLDPLYAMASAGKATITYEDAQRVLIHTYIFVGEMVKQTDIRPVIEVQKV